MPYICHMHQLVNVQIADSYVHTYTSYELSKINMWPEALVYIHFTLLAYDPEQRCLLQCICTFHCTANDAYMDPTLLHM